MTNYGYKPLIEHKKTKKLYHPSWKQFLTKYIMQMLADILSSIGDNYTPDWNNILTFLKTDLSSVKCVWLGQDPYHTLYDNGEKVACGTAFKPSGLKSWEEPFTQKSLQSIIRLIHKSYNDITEYTDIKSFNEIRKEITDNKFNILPPQEWFNSLEKQGVLFLNTYLTTEIGQPKAHRKLWDDFSDLLICYISVKNHNIHWFLWGKDAIEKQKYIQSGYVYTSRHPAYCSEKYEDDFLKNDCFEKTRNIINWLGETK